MSKRISHQFNCSKMILPEQSRALEKHRKEIGRQLLDNRGEPDQQLQEERQRMLEVALAKNLFLELVTLEKGCRQSYCGPVKGIDQITGEIIVHDQAFLLRRIKASDIIKMTLKPEQRP